MHVLLNKQNMTWKLQTQPGITKCVFAASNDGTPTIERTHTHAHVQMQTFTLTPKFTLTHTNRTTHTHTALHSQPHTHTHNRTHKERDINTQKHIHTHTHTLTHSHTHACAHLLTECSSCEDDYPRRMWDFDRIPREEDDEPRVSEKTRGSGSKRVWF